MTVDAPLDVIAVGAHPDDVEIGCGGTLALLAAQGFRVGIVDITDGEPTPRSSGPEERLREATAAAGVLGVVHREQLGFSNRRLFDSFEVRVALAKVFRRHRPRLVLGMAEKTPLASPDHAATVAITEAAVFYSRLTKWDDTFDGLPVHTVPALLNYFLVAGLPSMPTGYWPLVVDIGGQLEQKLEAIGCYRSQFPAEKAHVFDRVRSTALVVGAMGGCASGEILASPRLPSTTNLLKILFPE
ncbi:MAG: PIG-L family deacetylase [Planctomycetia bacterium]|nr:PIG-L family deacetylase [Planctomycetia bacterium]RLT15553.1 MAG: LmbE family protein [Planctomycetota bacterium]